MSSVQQALISQPAAVSHKIALALTGTNGSTSFPDTGTLGLTWSAGGNAQIDTSVHGTGDLHLDGNGDKIGATWPSSTPLSGDFSIKFYAWKSANGVGGFDTAIATDTSGSGTNGWIVELSSSRGFVFAFNTAPIISSNFNPNDSTDHLYEVRRVGTVLTLRKDGAVLDTQSYGVSATTTSGVITVGRLGAFNFDFNGHIWGVTVDF